jgi:hypothetical protein
VVATGFQNDDFGSSATIIQPQVEEEEIVATPTQEEQGEGGLSDNIKEIELQSKYRSIPAPIVRPSRNFAEIENCKRVPAYITHKISLTTATKTHQVAGVVSEEQPEKMDMPALF